jgi:hypothetical protein
MREQFCQEIYLFIYLTKAKCQIELIASFCINYFTALVGAYPISIILTYIKIPCQERLNHNKRQESNALTNK